MNPAGWCIKNNRTAFVFFLLIVALGIMAYQQVPRLETPEFTIRTAMIITHFPGAAPRKVEELVTEKIESKIQQMPEVIKLESQSMSGVSFIAVEVDASYMDMAPIWQSLRNKVNDVKPDLPDGVQGPFVNDEFGDVFPVMIAVTGDGYTYRELKDYADRVRDDILADPQVAKVEIFGTQAERIFVEFSNARLAETGVTPHQLMGILSGQNILQPGGNARVGAERILLEPTGAFKTINDIKRLLIRVPGQDDAVYLQDIADIRRGFVDPPDAMTRYNGDHCLTLAVSMSEGGKVTDMAPSVIRRVENIQQEMPWGIELTPFFSQEKYVTRSINDFMVNLLEAFGFVVIIMFIFTGWRMGLITGLLIPMAMLMCFSFMPVFGISLQQVSIAALIIALGMLVDNGVVTGENILVRLSAGEERLAAVKNAVSELWLPLLTSSMTTICAFLPIALATSDVAEYCVSLFQVVALTLLSSWFISITLIPLLCYYFLKPRPMDQTYSGMMYNRYRSILIWALKHKMLFCLLVLSLFAGSLWGFQLVPSIFFPPNEREMLLVDFWQPYGTDIQVTGDRLTELEDYLLSQTGEVESVASFVGSGGPRWYLALNVEQDNPNYANCVITLRDINHAASLEQQLNVFLAEHFPDCRYTVKQLENGPPVGAPVKIYISGRDVDTIYTLRERIHQAIADIPGIDNIRDDWGEWTKKLVIDVNQERAKQAGFTSEDVAGSLQSQISGLEATEFREGKNLIPVVIRSDSAYREDLGKVESMSVYSYLSGTSVPLLQIAEADLEWQPSNIRRRNRARTMTIQTDVSGGRFASDVLADVQTIVNTMQQQDEWPHGYTVEYGGEDAESAKAQNSIMEVVPLALGLLALILVGQFNSLRRPLVILLTIPPMLIGIVPGLLITSAPFGFMAFLGMISLMGIIVNNAIMMIDRIEIEKARGQGDMDAVVVAAQRRLRPIIVTAATTVIGLIPLSLQGGEMWRPMANTIIFGLAFSTLLTLLLCPVLYSLFFRIRNPDYKWSSEVLAVSND